MVKKIVSKAEFARMANVSHAAITKVLKKDLIRAVYGTRIDASHPSALDYLESHKPKPAIEIDELYDLALAHCKSTGVFTVADLKRTFNIGGTRARKLLQLMHNNQVAVTDGRTKEGRKNVEPVERGYGAKNTAAKNEDPIDTIGAMESIPEDIRSFADMSLKRLVDKFGTDLRFNDWAKALQRLDAIHEKRLKIAREEDKLIAREVVNLAILDPMDAMLIKLLSNGAKTMAVRAHAMVKADRSVKDLEKFMIDQLESFIKPMQATVDRVYKNGKRS